MKSFIFLTDSAKSYYKDARCTIRHREDGPAVDHVNGYKAWFLHHESYTESEYYIKIGRKNLILFI